MKKQAIAVFLLLATAVCHLAIHRAQDRAAVFNPAQDTVDLPDVIGTFRQVGPSLDVGDEIRAQLQTNAILIRNYVSPEGRPVQLTVVHAGKTRRSLHFPEVCLVGHGWEVRQQYSAPVGFLFTGKRLVLFSGNKQEAVLYWFKTGDKLTGSYFMNSWYWAKEQLLLRAPTSTMIKVSTPLGIGGDDAAFNVLGDFAYQLTPTLMERIR